MDERVACGSHLLAKRRHVIKVRVEEHRIFQFQGFRALDDLFRDRFLLEMAEHGQRIQLRAEIFRTETINSFAYFGEGLAFAANTRDGNLAVQNAGSARREGE